jgi:DNA-binding response OmpR family regulator
MNPAILHVLCIGPADRCNIIGDTLRQRGRCRISIATSYRELFSIPKWESFEIVILHQMLSISDFCESSAHIRRTWPCAKILVICSEADVLDDPLYDDWVAPSHSPDVLLAIIERLTACSETTRWNAPREQQAALQISSRQTLLPVSIGFRASI